MKKIAILMIFNLLIGVQVLSETHSAPKTQSAPRCCGI
jgi:hypothetical protein